MLKIENLTIGYLSDRGQKNILADRVNFSIGQNQLTAIIGPNGAGKSTLLNTLAGQLSPLNGSISLLGQSFKNLNPLQKAKLLAIVLTKKEYSNHLSVQEFVELGRFPYTNWLGRINATDQHIITRAIKATQLDSLMDQKCGTLSDGQRQRVSIARALAQDTAFILLDEPTTHLDLAHKAQTVMLLKNLSKQHNKGVIFSTHDIAMALKMADYIICVTPGLVITGTPDQLTESGAIAELFDSNIVQFDPNSRQFSILD